MGRLRGPIWFGHTGPALLSRLYRLVDPASPSVQSRAMSDAILYAITKRVARPRHPSEKPWGRQEFEANGVLQIRDRHEHVFDVGVHAVHGRQTDYHL